MTDPTRTSRGHDGVPYLALKGVTKEFPGVRALHNVDLELFPGEIHVLLGENGAGKSTLLKTMFGSHQPNEGEIRVQGRPVQFHGPRDAMDNGIAMVHQEMSLVPQMTAIQNISLGREKSRVGFVDMATRRSDALKNLTRLGFIGDPNAPISELGVAQQQIVELARAIATDAKLIILDEPTASLSLNETDRLFAILRELREEGHALVFVSHRMAEIFELGDRVTVLRDGEVVKTLLMSPEVNEIGLVNLMVGRTLDNSTPPPAGVLGAERLVVEGLTRPGAFHNVSLSVRAGEIVGLAGMVGAGRTELARGIVGADHTSAGRVVVDGQELRRRNPATSITAGIAYLTEDRKGQGLVMGMTLAENMTLPNPPGKVGWINRNRQLREAEGLQKRVALKGSVTRAAGTLSGGNQQKVVLAKWLATDAKVFIFDEPTRGIDVGAKSEIYALMEQLAERGAAILMISSELPEVLRMSSRILVMKKGELVAEMSRKDATEQAIVAAANLEKAS
jgi:ABC-type sugar transport system ATPase subunit